MSSEVRAARPTSGMAIAGLVLGILALLTSFLPIINNGSFVLALIGAALSVVGLVGTLRGKKGGKGLAIAATALNVISLVVVLVTQSAYSSAFDAAMDEVQNGPGVASVTSEQGADTDASQTTGLALGASVTLKDGLKVTAAETRVIEKYDGSAMTAVRVSYENTGTEQASFNTFDWKGQDAQGAQRSATMVSDDSMPYLGSGDLAAGGSAEGWIFLDGEPTEALYFASILSDTATATWALA